MPDQDFRDVDNFIEYICHVEFGRADVMVSDPRDVGTRADLVVRYLRGMLLEWNIEDLRGYCMEITSLRERKDVSIQTLVQEARECVVADLSGGDDERQRPDVPPKADSGPSLVVAKECCSASAIIVPSTSI